jgi:ribosomal protein S27AE
MSGQTDGYYSLYKETRRVARKEHLCSACGETIAFNHTYHTITTVFEGELRSLKRCERCQMMHLHLRELGDWDMWPDERLDCGEEYRSHWGKDAPPEIEALAFITQEEMQARVKEE